MKTQPYYKVRVSRIHGRGVFASRAIRKGTRVIEYTGPIISAREADQLVSNDDSGHSHTMLFSIDKKRVINGTKGGDARYINHSCSPNCEAVQDGDQIFIEAMRYIKPGEELTYDYHLVVEGKITDKVKKQYACFCGSPNCRGTQIAQEILDKQAKKDKKKADKKKAKEEKKRLKKEKAEAKAKAKQAKKNKVKKSKSSASGKSPDKTIKSVSKENKGKKKKK